jgi:acyl-coenzyme A synthetase/AMP-(fatty) acid ligase
MHAMNIADLIASQARLRPDAPAVIAGTHKLSFAALEAAVQSSAAALAAQGLGPGDTVGIALGFAPAQVIVLLALARLGAVSVQIPASEEPATRKAIVRQFKVSAVIALDKAGGVDDCGLVLWDGAAWMRKGRAAARASAPGGERPWSLMLSSGTTGTPRAIVRTHAEAIRLAGLQARLVDVRPDDRFLCCVSPALAASQMRLLRHLLEGSAVVFETGPELANAIERHGVTHTFVTPIVLESWVKNYRPGMASLKSMRHFASGGGPLTATLSAEFMEKVTPNFFVNYGTVETALAALADPQTHRRHPGSIGRVVPWLEAQVVDQDGKPLPPGQPGALGFRGEAVPTGYFPPETGTLEAAKAFRDGWFYPGDIARIDREGIVTIEGRADDMVNVGGAKISLGEIERALASHPDVIEVAAFRAASPQGWDLLMAAVVARSALDEQALLQYARARLGKRSPTRIFRLDALPRNAMGKIVRRELASLLT